MAENRGFFQRLFDLSFSEFITPTIIKLIFVLGILVDAIMAIGFVVGGFANGFFNGLVFLILSPLLFLFLVLMTRVYMELMIVIFRIAENTGRMAGRPTDQP